MLLKKISKCLRDIGETMLGLVAYDRTKFYAALGDTKEDVFLCVETRKQLFHVKTTCRSTRGKSRCRKIKQDNDRKTIIF